MQAFLTAVIAAGTALTGSAAEPATRPGSLADALRGGWVADVDGARHILILKIDGNGVGGTYCAVDCSDPNRLAFVDRGVLSADGATFEILQPGSRARTRITAHVVGGALELAVSAGRLRPRIPAKLTLRRDPRKPPQVTVEDLFARRGVTSGPLVIAGSAAPYVAPGPNEPLTPAKLEGLWVWSDGPGRQHFMFREVGHRMLGMVCGPCDNPWTFGPLDNIAIRGDTLTFDIHHEDWGIGIEFGPYANHATATLSRHELHLRTTQQNGPRTIQGDLVLTGPIRTTSR